MRRYIKRKALNWVSTMYRAHQAVEKVIAEKRFQLAYDLLVEMQRGAIANGTLLDETGEADSIVREMESFCELVWQISEVMQQKNVTKLCAGLKGKIKRIETKLKNEVTESKLEVVFLPYKSSMWDSLESIWREASKDEECNSYVVPIPYYSRNDKGQMEQFCYEGKDFPEDVPIIDYQTFDLEELHPDIIFFHNPFDEYNRVTSVDPMYYSSKIKNFTGLLVYVPYGISGTFENLEGNRQQWASFPGVAYSDKIIVQSKEMKKIILSKNAPESKLMLLGSPKLDAAVCCEEKYKVEKEENKTVFLLNTTIGTLLSFREKWFDYVENIITIFEQQSDLQLIWRPHPLLKDTVCSMLPEFLDKYNKLIQKVHNMNNIVIDNNPDVYPSFVQSDAMISDYSSLMLQYVATGKPILNTQECSEDKKKKAVVAFDYFSNYFVNDGMTYENFIQMVKENRDEKKEERIQAMRRSMINSDGTAGKKIYQECKKIM